MFPGPLGISLSGQALAAKIWPGDDPLGKFIKQGWPERPGTWRQIVGVIADIKFEGVTEETTMQVYMPFAQDPPGDFTLALRTAVEPASMVTVKQITKRSRAVTAWLCCRTIS